MIGTINPVRLFNIIEGEFEMKKEVVIAVVMLTLGVLLGSVLAVGAQSAAPLRVVYLVNGSLGDKGFYDSAASGLY